MSPMTRGRARDLNNIPTESLLKYYEQRATAGLIITEGTWVNKESIGFGNVPGIWSLEQVAGWEKITSAVHAKGGHIFLQLGHLGAFAHPDWLGGSLPLAPSAINAEQNVFTPTGPKPSVAPQEMTLTDIGQTVNDFKTAAKNAKEAGFDGVEIHVQGKSLISLFLYDSMNKRKDSYGGSTENKTRFLFEVLDAVTSVWGPDKVSVRLSPALQYPTMAEPFEDTSEIYAYIIKKLNAYHLAFLHIVNNTALPVSTENMSTGELKPWQDIASWYQGTIVGNGGLTAQSASYLISKGLIELASFGKPFIANPDLVYRFENNLELNEGNPATFYAGDEAGYIDYPFADPINF